MQWQCPSCGVTTENSTTCIQCGQTSTTDSQADDSSFIQQPKRSTLIEFPGVTRSSVPEWRKELSVRVREVQERRAREAAREAAEAERKRVDEAARAPQLELLPQAEAPVINPLVAAALRRIERANKAAPPDGFRRRGNTATAIAYAPSLEVHDAVPDNETAPSVAPQLTLATPAPSEIEDVSPEPAASHGLIVIPAAELASEVKIEKPQIEKPRPAKRLIVDDPNDPALNYLDSISRTLRVDDVSRNRASAVRRCIASLFDLITCALISSLIVLGLFWKGVDLTALGPLAMVAGSVVVITFLYLTLSIALAGRTWAMKLFSLRVIDLRTGLIPTGSQAAGRAFLYLISIAIAGFGILYALISREGETMHDHLTRTAVIKV